MFEYYHYKQNNANKCLPYSHQRVKQILADDYHCSLRPVGGYKCNRVRGYVQKYHMVNMDTGETILKWVTLNAIRIILTQERYPLKEEVTPNRGAMAFLKYVKELKNSKK